MSWFGLALMPLIAFAITVPLILLFRRLAPQLGLLDRPGGRKSHSGEVPVVGGIAMFLGALATLLADGGPAATQYGALAAATLMVGVGALDDRVHLDPRVRILVHLAAAVTLVWATGYRVETLGNLFGFGDIRLGALATVFTVVATIALVNAFNMLDGVDGIAGGVGLVALAGLSAQLFAAGSPAAAVGLAMAGAVVAFLAFNLPVGFNRRCLVFMGDAGSTLLGFALAGLALVAIQPTGPGLPPVVVLWLLPVPIVELFTTTIRRMFKGMSPMQADRGHYHHRLLDAGFSVRAVFLLYVGLSTTSALIGVTAWQAGASEGALFGAFVGLSLLWLIATLNAHLFVRYLPRWVHSWAIRCEQQTHSRSQSSLQLRRKRSSPR